MQDVWIGLTEVAKGERCELDVSGAGAFVWWATQADSESSFLRKVKNVLDYYKLVLLEITRIGRFEGTEDVPDDVYEIAERAQENEKWVLFGDFYTYPHHTA